MLGNLHDELRSVVSINVLLKAKKNEGIIQSVSIVFLFKLHANSADLASFCSDAVAHIGNAQ